MQSMPEFVRDETPIEAPAKAPASTNLTGWETVIFQLLDEPPESDSATAAIAP